jgi:hypothetical protein
MISAGGVVAQELDIAVGAYVGRGKALVVQLKWERQGDRGHAIVAVVAYVIRARHEHRARCLGNGVVAVHIARSGGRSSGEWSYRRWFSACSLGARGPG